MRVHNFRPLPREEKTKALFPFFPFPFLHRCYPSPPRFTLQWLALFTLLLFEALYFWKKCKIPDEIILWDGGNEFEELKVFSKEELKNSYFLNWTGMIKFGLKIYNRYLLTFEDI